MFATEVAWHGRVAHVFISADAAPHKGAKRSERTQAGRPCRSWRSGPLSSPTCNAILSADPELAVDLVIRVYGYRREDVAQIKPSGRAGLWRVQVEVAMRNFRRDIAKSPRSSSGSSNSLVGFLPHCMKVT